MADLVLPENVYQTSNDGGVGALTLLAPPAGHSAFSDWLANGAKTIATIKDGTDVETSRCTFNTGPDRITRDTLIRSTTGGFVNFSPGGVLDITCGMPGKWSEKLFNPDLANGIVARRDANGDLVGRTLGAGTWVSWSNPDGVSGAPSLVDSAIGANFARKNLAQTITGIQTFANAVILQAIAEMQADRLRLSNLPTNPFILRASADDTDLVLRLTRTGLDDYVAAIREGGAWKDLVHAASAGILAAQIAKVGGGHFDWTDPAQFDFTGDDGYANFPNGAQLRWGKTGTIGFDGTETVTFSQAFSTAAIGIVVTRNGGVSSSDGDSKGLAVDNLTTTTARIHGAHQQLGSTYWFWAWGN